MAIDDNDVIEKASSQFQLALSGIFVPFEGYGHDVFIPSAIRQVMELVRIYTERVIAGSDTPNPHFNQKREPTYKPDE